jgi:hypothetical protein
MMKIAIQESYRFDTAILHRALMRYSWYKDLNLVCYGGCCKLNSWVKRTDWEDAYLGTYYSNRTEDVIPYSDREGLFFIEDDNHNSKWIPPDDPVWVTVIEHLPYFGMKIVEIPDDVDWELKREYNYEEERFNEWVVEKHREWR